LPLTGGLDQPGLPAAVQARYGPCAESPLLICPGG
jgi:hypothetical protein